MSSARVPSDAPVPDRVQPLSGLPRDGYVVWDKGAEIRFKNPGQETLYETFTITDEEIAAIRAELAAADTDSVDRHYTVDLVDAEGTVHATVRKTVYVTTDGSKGA